MNTIQACLFDLDGVLVDTAKYHYIAWKELADKLGFEFTEKDNERLKGVSRAASLNILLEIGGLTFDESEKARLAEEKNNRYVEYISKMDSSEILPGALDFLKDCRESGIKVALGSASKNAMTILNNTGLTPYFDAIIDGTKTSAAKPDPEVFLLGAAELGVPAENCIVFEDAEAGIEAASRAEMASVGIGSPDTLGAANIVVPSLQDMNVARLREALSAV
ncbi:beta-phosphoglucomutase [Paenibacillus sp. HN-1]|uniref:beta-phosphoglucomutase n=1 Tax=Paenibacillus TaxID=44249 RepID=UPI001CAA1179|nr:MULTISPECIES: beta-phosphoglucomutase [Paenibacillus]MBY9080430.1 beta-phosphoglucomutase [Paenibacillus sp. CGMCC 1.18879]MBY9084010.1 beta-phosphoglucomutase [Paenibacillus sinensis]